jgi:hypothetical protein
VVYHRSKIIPFSENGSLLIKIIKASKEGVSPLKYAIRIPIIDTNNNVDNLDFVFSGSNSEAVCENIKKILL